jgi:hypothetical protein
VVRLEVSATVLKAKSLRKKASSSTTTASVSTPASAYIARRPSRGELDATGAHP